MLPALSRARRVTAREVIAERQIKHDEQPDHASDDKNPGDRLLESSVHEEEDDQQHLRDGNAQPNESIERSKVNLAQCEAR